MILTFDYFHRQTVIKLNIGLYKTHTLSICRFIEYIKHIRLCSETYIILPLYQQALFLIFLARILSFNKANSFLIYF